MRKVMRSAIAAVVFSAAVVLVAVPAARAAGTASISGTATDAVTGQPVSGLDVILLENMLHYPPGGPPVLAPGAVTYTVTDTNGHYSLTGLAASDSTGYWVCFGNFTGPAAIYAGQCYDNQLGFSPYPDPVGFFDMPNTAKTIVLGDGQSVTGIDAQMTLYPPPVPSYFIFGDVLGRDTQENLVGVQVEAFSSPTATVPVLTRSNTTGGFGLRLMSAGSYLVCFDAAGVTSPTAVNGYLDQCYRNLAWFGSGPPSTGSTPVPVTDNSTSAVAAYLDPAAGVAGVVTQSPLNLSKLAGVRAYAMTASGVVLGSAVTNSKGAYRIRQLPAGAFHVCFDASHATGGITAKGYLSRCYGKVVNTALGQTSTVNIGINASV